MATKQVAIETKLQTPGLEKGISDWEKLTKLIESLPELLKKAGGGTKELASQLAAVSAAFQKGGGADGAGGINGLQDQVKVLSGLLKSMGTITKAAAAVMPKEEQTKTQIQALREFAKAMREASQAAQELQRQQQIKAGTFGMDNTTLKGVDAAVKKLQGELLATKQMIDNLGLDKRKTKTDPIVAQGAAITRNLQNLEGLRGNIVSAKYLEALELDKQRDIVRAQTEKAEAERAQKKKDKAEEERRITNTRAQSAKELEAISAASDKVEAENDERRRKEGVKRWEKAKKRAETDANGLALDKIRDDRDYGVLQGRRQDGRVVAAENTTALARGEGRDAFIRRGSDSDKRTLLNALDITPAMLSKSSELRGVFKQIQTLTREIGDQLIKNGGVESDSTREASKKLGELQKQVKTLREAEVRKNPEDLEANRANSMLARAKGQGGAALLAVQATLIANYGLLQGFLNSGRAAISTSVELEAAFKNIQAVTATTSTEMVGLQEKIKDVAASSKFSAVEVAGAALILGQAGLSAKETGVAIESVVRLATAAGTSLSQAVDLVTSVVGVFDKQVSDTADVANKITQAANTSKISVEKLALALQYVGNTASQTGVNFEETTAALSVMSNAGIKSGSTMGTGLRQFMVEVQKPSKEFLDTLKQLGLSLSDVDMRAKGLVGVVTTLREAGFTASEAIKSFDVRGAAAFNALLADPAALQRQYEGLLNTKAAMAANEIQMDSLQAQGKRLTTSLTNLAATGLEPLSAVLTKLFSGFSDLLQSLSQYPVVFHGLATAVSAFIGVGLLRHFIDIGAGAIKLMGITGALATGITTLSTATVGTTLGLTATATATTAVGAAATAATPAVGALAGAMQWLTRGLAGMSLLTGLGLVIAGLTGVYMGVSYAAGAAKREMDKLTASANDSKAAFEESNKIVTSVNKRLEDLEYRQANLDKGLKNSLAPTLLELQAEFGKLGFKSEGVNGVWATMIERLKGVRDGMKEVADMRLATQLATEKTLAAEANRQAREAIDEATRGPARGVVDTSPNLAKKLQDLYNASKLATLPVAQGGIPAGSREAIQSGINAIRPGASPETVEKAIPAIQFLLASIKDEGLKVRVKALSKELEGFSQVISSATSATAKAADTEAVKAKRDALTAAESAKIFNGKTFAEAMPPTTEVGSVVRKEDASLKGVPRFNRVSEILRDRLQKLESVQAVLQKQIDEGGTASEGALQLMPRVQQAIQNAVEAGNKAVAEVAPELDAEVKGKIAALRNSSNKGDRSHQNTKENNLSLLEQELAIKDEDLRRRSFGADALAKAKSQANANAIEAKMASEAANQNRRTMDDNVNQTIAAHKSQAESLETMAKSTKAKASGVEDLNQIPALIDQGVQRLFEAKAERLKALTMEQEKRVATADTFAATKEFKDMEQAALSDEFDAKIVNYIVSFREITTAAAKRIDRDTRKMKMLSMQENYDQTKFRGEVDVYNMESSLRGLNLEVAKGDRQEGDSAIQRAKIKTTETQFKALTEELVALGTMSEGWLHETFVAFEDAKSERERLENVKNTLEQQSKSGMNAKDQLGLRAELEFTRGALKQAQTTEAEALAAYRGVFNSVRTTQQKRDEVNLLLTAQREALPQEGSLDNINRKLTQAWDNYKRFVTDMDITKTLGVGLKGVLEGLTGTVSSFFMNLTSRTMTAKEAFRSMAISIIKSMMEVVSQALAMKTLQSIFGMFMGGASPQYSLSSGPSLGMTATPGQGLSLAGGSNFGTGLQLKAKGGPIRGGIPGKDSVGILAMPGEYVLKKSAVDAVGESFLHDLNNQTTSTVSSASGGSTGLARREPDLTNVWIVAPEAKPTMGPKDVLMVITDDMMRGGATRQLVKQIQSGG